ncbi:MAG: biopolymer transporter ExbD [Chitinophagales bacterium]|jgi:biopolymer transport protein ExbD|nr:biopolymer transporter ExbD [Chitinophagales bacterium]
MPKHKIARKSTNIDMTAMCDVAFLLLTFFILTAKAKPEELVTVTTPSSISEIRMPDVDMILITADTAGRVFFEMDGQPKRLDLINAIDEKYALQLTDAEKKMYSIRGPMGLPVEQLKGWLNDPHSIEADKMAGIPYDSLNNQLDSWIIYARVANPMARIAIKADAKTPYPTIKKIMNVLQDRKINQFNLITNLEANPNKPEGGETAHKE